ncbi:glycoside hydrolase family 88 protein [Lapidilactobacillus luobeiensis]|uniref:glycoside hydrolase family 88 protein n=1 Tax=Lapidilactobacillus luobeiensis TaxID=2950371 RepID=UPI0021C283C7|nr:glycoside hydrolase family 88 protein [Lapidilactobacillus luobeiensis]
MDNEKELAQTLLQQVITKIKAEISRLDDQIPYIPVEGQYSDMGKKDIVWWTNGFWPGLLWLLYQQTHDEIFRQCAEKCEMRLDSAFDKFIGLHHDVGFMWQLSAVADYRLTDNERSQARGLHAATLLAGRYNPRGKFIRSWNHDRAGWVIIDSMMNISILYWAAQELNDPRFKFIATDHADTVMNNLVRPDGSVAHIGVFDPNTGQLLETLGGQGYETGSSWSRGQAWAIYGFALSYRHTKNNDYLNTAKRVANYFIANIVETNYIPLVDFRAPQHPRLFDTSAGLCAACGLLEIARQVPKYERDFYYQAGFRIIKAVASEYLDLDPNTDGIVKGGAGAYHDNNHNVKLIYSDFYFIEALLGLLSSDFLIW